MNPTDSDPNNPPGEAVRRTSEVRRTTGSSRDDRWFRSLVENVSDIITILEADGTIRYVSPAVERVLGYRPEELVGTSIFDLLHPADVERGLGILAEVLETSGLRQPLEFRVPHKDGSWRYLEHVVNNMLDDPSVRGIVVNSRDVTERKEAEEKLKESEERFRLLAENAQDFVFRYRLKPTPGFEYVSPSATAMIGYTPEEHYADSELRLKTVHPDDRHLINEVLHYPEVPVTIRWLRKDGTVIWAEQRNKPIYDEAGELVAIEGISRDITERKRTEEALRRSEERYRAIVEEQTELVCRFLPDLTLTFVNDAYCRYFGEDPEELIGSSFMGHIPVEDHIHYEGQLSRLNKENPTRTVEHRVFMPDGGVRWQQWTDRAIFDEEGRLVEFQSVGRDVTERKEAEEAVRRNEASLAESQRIAHLGTWEWDVVTDKILWSDETFRIYGFEPNAFVPTFEKLVEVVHPDDRSLLRAAIDDALAGIKPYDFEHRIAKPNGEVRWVHRQAEVVRGVEGEPLRMIGTVHDITERKALEERLEHQAFHDSLTDLPNRHLFVDRLGLALGRTKRKQRRQVAVLFMDLDDFKAINDSLGHELGDLLLVIVAQRLRRCLRPEDTLARFGGDEFVVLIEDVGSPQDAVRVAERLVEGLREPFVVDGREMFLRASIGVALGTVRQKSPEDLLRDADTAMYEAKEEGLAHRVFDPAMYQRAVKRLEMESELRRAIEADEFVLHYQPILNLESGEVRAVEALVRWNHPEQGLLDPEEFVQVAEESGLIIPMDERVLEEACRQAKEWQEEHPRTPPLVMSVNLSARQLQRPDIAQIVERVLKKTGLEARYLRLDITETVYIKALEGNTQALDELQRMEVCISIDDFGTGYSSLAYLKRLPANALKIDKSFVKGIGEDLEDTAIVRMVIELAHTLGMEVIAEGVESEAQATLLKEMDCNLAQGFHFSEPLPPAAAIRFLAEERTS